MTAPPNEITRLLLGAKPGHTNGMNKLIPLVYEELRTMAHQRLIHERTDHTLNTTALVHEAYLKMVDQTRVQCQNRTHFFALAAQAMRRILVNYAVQRKTAKRGGDAIKLSLDTTPELANLISLDQPDELLALDEAMKRLEQFNERGCRIVEYRFFGGLSYDEIAEVLGVAPITVRRSWTLAKTWLRQELDPNG